MEGVLCVAEGGGGQYTRLMQRIQQPGIVPLLTTGCAYASQLSLVRQCVPTVATWRRERRGWAAAGELG